MKRSCQLPVASCQLGTPPVRLHWQLATGNRQLPRAFTLIELLIVIGIIVLVALIAVPAFRAMSGGRSTEAAQNQMSAILGRARLDAMGLQEIRGVMFYRDVQTQRAGVVFVKEIDPPVDPTPLAGGQLAPEVYLDLVEDRDQLLLPIGVGFQTIDDPGTATKGTADQYVGFNTNNSSDPTNDLADTVVPHGGVILFDGLGRLITLRYALRVYIDPDGGPPSGGTLPGTPTNMGRFLYNDPNLADESDASKQSFIQNPTLRSQIGFVLFDNEAFTNNETFKDDDPQINKAPYAGGDEPAEEIWLDENAIPQLINRYNGTLLRAE